MTRRKQRKTRIALGPPVATAIGSHRVTFVGLNLLRGVVMVEYDVDPPLLRDAPIGPALLELRVKDDLSEEVYPTAWEDFPWPDHGAGRLTTRLDRRPPPEARRLHIDVLPLGAARANCQDSLRGAIAHFEVALPPEHGQPPPQRQR